MKLGKVSFERAIHLACEGYVSHEFCIEKNTIKGKVKSHSNDGPAFGSIEYDIRIEHSKLKRNRKFKCVLKRFT